MSATDELRRLLDERGVEWDYGITGAASTKFNANGVELTFIGMRDGVTCSTILTPAQAVAATLGPATENAKLRELCADVWHLFTEHGAVHPCDLPVVDAVRERMCELGVEVDG